MFILRLPVQKWQVPYLGLNCIRPKPVAGYFCRKASYIVLIPEVPKDTPETNSLLCNSEFPNFKDHTVEKCYTGNGKHCLDYEAGVWGLEKKIQDRTLPKTFSAVIDELDKLEAPLTYAWNTIKLLFTIKKDDLSDFNCFKKINARQRKAMIHKYQNKPIYEACKEMYEKDTTLNKAQKRVIHKFILEGRLNGLDLPVEEMEVLAEHGKKIEEYKNLYLEKLAVASKRFSYRIIDPEIVHDFPKDLLKRMSDDSDDYLSGPWIVTHDPMVYHKFMEYCPEKDLRLYAWESYILRASLKVREISTSLHVEEIRGKRLQMARLLGFKNFGEMSMETKMAGSIDNVYTVITSLFEIAKDQQLKEMNTLKEFAEGRRFRGELEECDVPFWRRKQLTSILKVNEAQLEKYFPFEHVWEQLLSLCSGLFGVQFGEAAPGQVETWHPDVRVYHVLDDSCSKKIGSFYLDPYARPNQKLDIGPNSAWVMPLKSQCDAANTSPLTSLVFNFLPCSPENGNVSLLTLQELESLFKMFGRALQDLLSTVPYGQVSGRRNMEWDAVDMCSNFLLNWLYDPSVLKQISKHSESGAPLDQDGIQSMVAIRKHMAGYDLCNELFLSDFDMQMNTEDMYWGDILKPLWHMYKPFFKHTTKNSLPCNFSPIITDASAASYYSHTWSKMLAADVYSAFQECKPEEVSSLGLRFRDTFLSLGGGLHSSQVFREFRGRDPMPKALPALLFDNCRLEGRS